MTTTTTQDFETMTADEIASYRGPVFRATVTWLSGDGTYVRSDLESTSDRNLREKIAALKAGARVDRVDFGPITTGTGVVIDTDARTGTPLLDDPDKYARTAPWDRRNVPGN